MYIILAWVCFLRQRATTVIGKGPRIVSFVGRSSLPLYWGLNCWLQHFFFMCVGERGSKCFADGAFFQPAGSLGSHGGPQRDHAHFEGKGRLGVHTGRCELHYRVFAESATPKVSLIDRTVYIQEVISIYGSWFPYMEVFTPLLQRFWQNHLVKL